MVFAVNSKMKGYSFLFLLAIVVLMGCEPASVSTKPVGNSPFTTLTSGVESHTPTPTLPSLSITDTPSPTPVLSPTSNPSGAIDSGFYAVVMVEADDVLNIRSKPGVNAPIIGTFPYDATNVVLTGPSSTVFGDTWVEVQKPDGGTGWVNFYYLTEQVAPQDFCADVRGTNLVEQFRQAVISRDGNKLASLVSPRRGLNVHYFSYTPEVVHLSPSKIVSLFTAVTPYNWGPAFLGGPDEIGPFSTFILPELLDVLEHPEYQIFCQELNPEVISSLTLEAAWPAKYTNFRYYTLYRPAAPDSLDWHSWVLVIEYVDYSPTIMALLQYRWEP